MNNKKNCDYTDIDYFETPAFAKRIKALLPESIWWLIGFIFGEIVLLYLVPFLLATFRIESMGWAPVPAYYSVVKFSAKIFIKWYVVFYTISTFIFIPFKSYQFGENAKKPASKAAVAAVTAGIISNMIFIVSKNFMELSGITNVIHLAVIFFTIPAFIVCLFVYLGYKEKT